MLPYAAARLALGDASADGTFRRALADDDVLVRLEAVDVLAALDAPGVGALLDRAASLGPDLVRARAELAIAVRGTTGAAQINTSAASDDDETRAMAMRAVSEAAPQLAADKKTLRAVQATVTEGFSDSSPPVRLEAFRAATRLPWSQLPEGVRDALSDDAQAIRTEAAALVLLTP